ncbi:MAG: nuclear transport factor 2 family protein [Solirubrobacterales bacterium]
MASERVELVRNAFAFERGRIEALRPFLADDLAVYALPDWPDDSEYHGHDGMRKLTDSWTEHFEDFGFELVDLLDADEQVVCLLERASTRSAATGNRRRVAV